MVSFPKPKHQTPIVVGVNLTLVVLIVTIFAYFSANSREKIRVQNVDEITNSNVDSARVAKIFLSAREQLLTNSVHYIEEQKMDLDSTLRYIAKSDVDPATVYEVIGANSKGYVAREVDGAFPAVSYASHDSWLRNTFANAKNGVSTSVAYLTEFTDEFSANNSFAAYEYVELPSASGNYYTILSILKSAEFAGVIELKANYAGTGTVLMNANGDYVFGSSTFKSTNLFSYFYTFNGLSVDERDAIREKFKAWDKQGSYYFNYKNSSGEPCLFVCSALEDSEWYCVSSVPLSSYHNSGSDIGYVGALVFLLAALMIFDILWLRRINRELKVAAQKAKEAGDAKTDFLSRMSHDIRTPLNVINGSTILALKETNPPATDKYLKDIHNSGIFLLSLVNDILDLNKIGSGKLELHVEPYSLKDFGDSMSSIIGNLCDEKGLSFTLTGCEGSQVYILDPVRIKQIFFNILSNSAKFTNRGGHVSLDVAVTPLEGDNVNLIFTAKDDGVGMSKEFQGRMFDPFTQENRSVSPHQGTGLGLSIVKQLVDLMGGALQVTSQIDQGTTFIISIPSQKTDQPAAQRENKERFEALLKDKLVLVVEDNDINAQITTALLKDKGIKTLRAVDGIDAVEKFEASAPRSIDAVLMDMRMPRLDGLGATKAIRALPRPDAQTTPIIAMTANAFDDDINHCLASGMNAHLSKPIDPDALYQSLCEQIRKKR